MAQDWDLSKFYADMMNYMPIASLRRKITEAVELRQFADSDKCTHISDLKPTEDRDLEIFSDDLFRYLLLKRLKITEYHSLLKRTPEDPISKFHPLIGMSVLYCSYRIQKKIFLEILENKVENQNLDSIAAYYTDKVFALRSLDECSVFRKLRILASITLELGAFCYLQGNGNAIHYVAALYRSALQHTFKGVIDDNGGWNAWHKFALNEVKVYEENQSEIPVMDAQMIVVCERLQRFDRWIARLPCLSQIESSMAGNESANQSDNVKGVHDAAYSTTYESEKMPDDTASGTKEDRLRCLYIKDCPASQRFQNMSDCLILELIAITSSEPDSAYEEILQVIENDVSIEALMRYCLLPKLIILIRDAKRKMRNIDILQCMKLLLKDNARMATYCFLLVCLLHQELDKVKSLERKDSEKKSLDMTAEKSNRQESYSNMDSVERLSPIKVASSSVYHEHKNLLNSFLLAINANDQLCTSTVSEICEILSNQTKTEILLTSGAFKLILKTTVDWPVNRWGDEWLLSVMRLLINNSQTNVLGHHSTEDGAQKSEHLSNEVSVVHTNPQLTESVPYSVTETGQSSVPSLSDRDDIGTEPTCDTTNTAQDETPNEDMLSFNMCEQCFISVKEKLTRRILENLEKRYPTAAESGIPEKETSVKEIQES